MKKDNIKSIAVLGSICLIAAILLAAVNYITEPVIQANAAANANASLKIVLPDAADFEELTLEGDIPATVTGIYRDTGGSGYAVTVSATSSYSQSPMTFTLGIGNDGKIVAVEVTNYAETKDFGSYPQTFVGADSALGGIDVAAGATYSSTAFKDAVSDAFSVLIGMGGISEGQKSEEQIIDELKVKALPGATTAAGTIKLKDFSASVDGVTEAYVAENGVGWVFVCDTDAGKLVAAVSATGGAVCYDLEEKDVTADNADLVASLLAACDRTAIAEKNLAAVQKAVGEGAVVTPVEIDGQFGTLTGVYTVEGAEKLYAFTAAPIGYMEPVKFIYVLNEAGEIKVFRAVSELIQEADYYSDYTLDETSYKEGLLGLTGDTLTEDVCAISGATLTATAVHRAASDSFKAFDAIKEAGK